MSPVGCDRRLHHFGEVAEVAEVEGDTLPVRPGQRMAVRAAREVRDLQQHVAHACHAEIAECVRLAAGFDQHPELTVQRQAEGEGVLAADVCKFIDEGLNAKARALDRGARSEPVGTPDCMTD